MGCCSSSADSGDTPVKTRNEAFQSADEFKPGYECKGPEFAGQKFVDYRGITSSTALSASKEKSDGVCIWADKVLAVRELSGSFCNPEDPSSWPAEVLEYYKVGKV